MKIDLRVNLWLINLLISPFLKIQTWVKSEEVKLAEHYSGLNAASESRSHVNCANGWAAFIFLTNMKSW